MQQAQNMLTYALHCFQQALHANRVRARGDADCGGPQLRQVLPRPQAEHVLATGADSQVDVTRGAQPIVCTQRPITGIIGSQL